MLFGNLRFVHGAPWSSLQTQQQLTPSLTHSKVGVYTMPVPKIQIGQLWKKDGTGDTYLVTRVYTEALSTFVVLRKSGSEGEALTRVKAERNAGGHSIPGFTPAQEDEHF
jgi:hypothetical protein